jgi:hypothetical protein
VAMMHWPEAHQLLLRREYAERE